MNEDSCCLRMCVFRREREREVMRTRKYLERERETRIKIDRRFCDAQSFKPMLVCRWTRRDHPLARRRMRCRPERGQHERNHRRTALDGTVARRSAVSTRINTNAEVLNNHAFDLRPRDLRIGPVGEASRQSTVDRIDRRHEALTLINMMTDMTPTQPMTAPIA